MLPKRRPDGCRGTGGAHSGHEKGTPRLRANFEGLFVEGFDMRRLAAEHRRLCRRGLQGAFSQRSRTTRRPPARIPRQRRSQTILEVGHGRQQPNPATCVSGRLKILEPTFCRSSVSRVTMRTFWFFRSDRLRELLSTSPRLCPGSRILRAPSPIPRYSPPMW
jgi:hypothetical protein